MHWLFLLSSNWLFLSDSEWSILPDSNIALNPAYELSFFKTEEQRDLLDAMDSEQATQSLSQAQRLKKFSQDGHLSIDVMRAIMGEEKKSDLDRVTFTSDTLRKYFPRSYTPARMQETIIKLLEAVSSDRSVQCTDHDKQSLHLVEKPAPGRNLAPHL